MKATGFTIAKPIEVAGIGLHSGEESLVRLLPRAKSGIALTVNGKPLALAADHMRPTPLRTTLVDEDVELATPEHLLAALHGLRVLGLEIEVEGCPEVPILDGSARPWVAAIDAASRVPLEKPAVPLKVKSPATYTGEGRVLMASPYLLGGLKIECSVEFAHPAVGFQSWRGLVDEAVFRNEIAPARSFALQADVEAAMAAGLLKGASLESGVLMTREGTIANPHGLRFPDEPVRHKVLDFIGDAFLTGRVLEGDITLNAPGHTANNTLLRAIVAQEYAR